MEANSLAGLLALSYVCEHPVTKQNQHGIMHSSQIVKRGKIYKVKEDIEDFKRESGIISYLYGFPIHLSSCYLPNSIFSQANEKRKRPNGHGD
jgi:hypothetical protein